MNWALMGFMMFCYLGCSLGGRMMEGGFMGSDTATIINQFSLFRDISVFNLFTLPAPNLDFFKGLPYLMQWNYSYFGGNAVIIQYFLVSLSVMFGFMLFVTIMIYAVQNYFGRAR